MALKRTYMGFSNNTSQKIIQRAVEQNPRTQIPPKPYWDGGSVGTVSALHIDQMCSHFWMHIAAGEKHWVTFHPDDVDLLSPVWDEQEREGTHSHTHTHTHMSRQKGLQS
eukprot:2304759-Amphidinium_carterae.1